MSLDEARRRHPSTQPPVAPRRVVSRVARLLDGPGVRWPEVAAGVLQVRGRTGASPEELAARMGIGADVVHRAEAGALAMEELPQPLRAQVAAVLADAAPCWSG